MLSYLLLQMFLSASRCCVSSYRCFSLHPDVVSGGVLLRVPACCCDLLSGQCHRSLSGSSLSIQQHRWSDLGGSATTRLRPVCLTHTHTDQCGCDVSLTLTLRTLVFVSAMQGICITGLCGLECVWSPEVWFSGTRFCLVSWAFPVGCRLSSVEPTSSTHCWD